MTSEGPLAGATAVVTGALGRLGPVWVRALCAAGARVVGVDIDDHGADDLVAQTDGAFVLEQADVTDRGALESIALRIGAPHVLVNSAGIDQPPDAASSMRRIEEIPIAEFHRTVDVNLGGVFVSTQMFGAPMAAAGRGAIVNIGSLYAGIAPDPSFYDHLNTDPPFLKPAAYGASKAGVISLTRYFARLWGPAGVRVNALSPGGVLADQDEEFRTKYTARVPLRRMALPADLGGPLVFLASDASSYMTGHELRVDGGFTA